MTPTILLGAVAGFFIRIAMYGIAKRCTRDAVSGGVMVALTALVTIAIIAITGVVLVSILVNLIVWPIIAIKFISKKCSEKNLRRWIAQRPEWEEA